MSVMSKGKCTLQYLKRVRSAACILCFIIAASLIHGAEEVFEAIYNGQNRLSIVTGTSMNVQFVGTYEGVPYDFALSPLQFSIGHEVLDAEYADKNRVWVISHLSRGVRGAVLVNVVSHTVEQEYEGFNIEISPDKQLVAYSDNWGRAGGLLGVFINDLMCYPQVIPAVVKRPEGHFLSDGRFIGDVLTSATLENRLAVLGPIRWEETTGIKFLIEETDEETSPPLKTFYRTNVSLSRDGATTPTVTNITTTTLTALEAKWEEFYLRTPNFDEMERPGD